MAKSWAELQHERMENDPDLRAAYELAKAELDAATETVCSEGCCVVFIGPTGEDLGGWGPVGCPHEERADD